MTTHGSHRPSGLDANERRRILTHFGQQGVETSKPLAIIKPKIMTEILSCELREPYNACRLSPLRKKSGVRVIGIDEVIRRTTGRTITKCLKSEAIVLGLKHQRCLGQKCGFEYAIYTLR